MTAEEAIKHDKAVAQLNAMSGKGDPETDHIEADEILLSFVPEGVKRAYEGARKRVGFWYA